MSASRTVCHRCGSTVARYELSLDKVNVATVDDFKFLALWCSTCSGILCLECAGVHIAEDSILLGYGFCPVCKERTEPANEQQIEAPMSRSLKKAPPARGFFGKLFGQARPAPGSFAYLFVATQYKQPTDSQVANEYLLEVANMCAPGWTSAPPQSRSKMAALWETDAVDRGQLIAWASQAFGEEFKAMSTKYDLSFSRFEHRSESGQVLVARHR